MKNNGFSASPLAACMLAFMFSPIQALSTPLPRVSVGQLEQQLQVGDIIFIHVDVLPFRKIARDTGSWTNHVGIVVELSDKGPLVAESTFPFSKITPLSTFVARSKEGRVETMRLNTKLTLKQRDNIKTASLKRLGKIYDTGFNLHSSRQFCSRFVYEVANESLGIKLGEIESLRTLFANNPKADLLFWKIWYFGQIPWERETVTPASIQHSPHLRATFDGYADNNVAIQ